MSVSLKRPACLSVHARDFWYIFKIRPVIFAMTDTYPRSGVRDSPLNPWGEGRNHGVEKGDSGETECAFFSGARCEKGSASRTAPGRYLGTLSRKYSAMGVHLRYRSLTHPQHTGCLTGDARKPPGTDLYLFGLVFHSVPSHKNCRNLRCRGYPQTAFRDRFCRLV